MYRLNRHHLRFSLGTPHFSQPIRQFMAPYIVLPTMAVVLLLAIWTVTWHAIEKDHQQADADALQQTKRLMDAYEANTLRALGEINQTFKLMDYAYAEARGKGTFATLQRRNLLLPNMIFTTRLIDRKGRVVASSKASSLDLPVDQAMLAQLATNDEVFVSQPSSHGAGPEPVLQMGRRIGDASSSEWHIVEVTMPASYLVSDYDEARLGKQGVLAVLGKDDVFLVKRTGAATRSGEHVSYQKVVAALQELPENAALVDSPWDGEARYTAARPLYGYPLVVVVALSRQEHLKPTIAASRQLLAQAAFVSAGVVLFAGFFSWVGKRLAVVRRREREIQRAHSAQIEHQAYHDALTALPNRALFTRTLNRHLTGTHESREPFALLFLDLDGFKKINDAQGHQAGDELLKQVAQRLAHTVRPEDFVARLGGDEFVVLLRGVQEIPEARQIAERLVTSVARPYDLLGREGRITVSIGVCLCPQDGMEESVITRCADEAMYFAKQNGKNNVQFYSHIPRAA